MKRIKRTKITVIRTETVFMKKQVEENDPDREGFKATFLLEQNLPDPAPETQIIEEETDLSGDNK